VLLPHAGATKLLDADAFRRCFPTFKQCRYVQVGYFGLLPSLTADLPTVLAELRREAPQTKVALDTVNPPDTWERLRPILPHVDLFCPSRTEAAALTNESSPEKMVARFREHMPAARWSASSSTPRAATSTTAGPPSPSRPTRSTSSTRPAPATPGSAAC
jgi:sugar/nucleoside kinase (ribokinase family)